MFINIHTAEKRTVEELRSYGLNTTDINLLHYFGWYTYKQLPEPTYDKYTSLCTLTDIVEHVLGTDDYTCAYKIEPISDTAGTDRLKTYKEKALSLVDKTTREAILAGFNKECTVLDEQVTLHFSYDEFDQCNFTDSSSAAYLIGLFGDKLPSNIPTSVDWNAYTTDTDILVVLHFTAEEFLELYKYAVRNKQSLLDKGNVLKASILECDTLLKLKSVLHKEHIVL